MLSFASDLEVCLLSLSFGIRRISSPVYGRVGRCDQETDRVLQEARGCIWFQPTCHLVPNICETMPTLISILDLPFGFVLSPMWSGPICCYFAWSPFLNYLRVRIDAPWPEARPSVVYVPEKHVMLAEPRTRAKRSEWCATASEVDIAALQLPTFLHVCSGRSRPLFVVCCPAARDLHEPPQCRVRRLICMSSCSA